MIELMVVMSVMLVAVSIFYQMVIATSRLRSINHENSVAIEGARSQIEAMRNRGFDEVWALYNSDPGDDPDGAGTAPGPRFAVDGLEPLPGTPDGLVGEILFPAVFGPATEDEEDEESLLGGLVGGLLGGGRSERSEGGGGGGGGAPPSVWQLREDLDLPDLGMPRDLNGDSMIDSANHAEDYILLPVQVRVRWNGAFGERELDLFTMLGEFRL